jgi:hypothetical protein
MWTISQGILRVMGRVRVRLLCRLFRMERYVALIKLIEFDDGDTLIVMQTVAIIDIDCAELDGFNKEDQEALEALADLLARSCDFQ